MAANIVYASPEARTACSAKISVSVPSGRMKVFRSFVPALSVSLQCQCVCSGGDLASFRFLGEARQPPQPRQLKDSLSEASAALKQAMGDRNLIHTMDTSHDRCY